MTKVIIFGQGYLGTRIAEALGYELAPKFDVLDIAKLESYLDTTKPDVVINAIGKTGGLSKTGFNIDWCETHKEETIRSNVLGALNLGIECCKRQIYFVHLGSGCIYQGDNNGKGYTENDEPNFFGPQFYAKTKILSEKALKELPGKILQLRIRMPIDNRSTARNLIDKLKSYPKIIDVQNSMTTVPHMLQAIKTLIERRATGIYNLTNPGTISAKEIMKLYTEIVDPNHKVEVMTLQELDAKTVGKRSNCMLDTSKLKAEGINMPEIHDAVKECLQNYKRFIQK